MIRLLPFCENLLSRNYFTWPEKITAPFYDIHEIKPTFAQKKKGNNVYPFPVKLCVRVFEIFCESFHSGQ